MSARRSRGQREVAHVVQDHVIPGPPVGEVLAGVVDDVGSAERADQLGVASAAHAGDLGTQGGRDLDGVRAHLAAGPVDEHLLAGLNLAHLTDLAQGRRRRDGNRGRLLEGQARRLGHHLVRPGARVLCERAPAEPEHRVARPQLAHVHPGRFHDARYVDSGYPRLRPGQPHAHQPRDQRVPPQDVPVGRVERRSMHTDQHVAVPHLRQARIDQLQGIRRAEPVLHDSLHRVLP